MKPQDQRQLQHGCIVYRALSPSDKPDLKRLHDNIFPIDYHDDFFSRAVTGSGIISFAAVLSPSGRLTQDSETADETLLGFITACERSSSEIPMVHKQSRIAELSGRKSLYILTLGVTEVGVLCCFGCFGVFVRGLH